MRRGSELSPSVSGGGSPGHSSGLGPACLWGTQPRLREATSVSGGGSPGHSSGLGPACLWGPQPRLREAASALRPLSSAAATCGRPNVFCCKMEIQAPRGSCDRSAEDHSASAGPCVCARCLIEGATTTRCVSSCSLVSVIKEKIKRLKTPPSLYPSCQSYYHFNVLNIVTAAPSSIIILTVINNNNSQSKCVYEAFVKDKLMVT